MKKNKKIRKLNKILTKIKKYSPQMEALSDEQLAGLTKEFKRRYKSGESLDKMLPEVYAAVCEADKRILGMYPYDVQIIGGIALHQGLIIEMNTGEGKTLMATMPLYLNALTEKSTILITTNEYLAKRDAEEMGPVYKFMGLSVAAGVGDDTGDRLSNEEKKKIYASDIVYTTQSVLGFDYLINNLVKSKEERFLRDYYFAVLDEADEVLLDGAQTPLVISGAPRVQSNLYDIADFFVTTLKDEEFEVEEESVWFTYEGIKHAQDFFGIDNFFSPEYFEINRHANLALRAHYLFKADKDYVVTKDGELFLLDNGSGRMLPGVKLQGCQHQAIEAKEKVEVSQENRSVASITLQNLFLMFPKLSGMSGTIFDVREELKDVYGKDILVIPPNKKVIRTDYEDKYYTSFERQFEDALELVAKTHKTGQPVLVVTSTIAETEYISSMLLKNDIAHNVLNANSLYWEAQIIKEAGKLNAVTVSTSIAGRGTDIKLGEGVDKLGGLAVVGIGRMANIRQERQARGRSGRQGDPGFSQFFVSLEDDIVNAADSEKLMKYVEGKRRINKYKLKRIINSSQRIGEERDADSRKKSFEYDLVMQLERKIMYKTRNNLLDGGDLSSDMLVEIANKNFDELLKSRKLSMQQLQRYILDNLSYKIDDGILGKLSDLSKKERIRDCLVEVVLQGIRMQYNKIGSSQLFGEFVRRAALSAIDDAWIEQVDYLQQLRSAVAGRTSAQRNVSYEYQREALETFRRMEKIIYLNIVRNILLSNVSVDEKGELKIVYP